MNTIKRLITASAALIISLQFAHAQYTVKGVVRDFNNSDPIPGATIAVPNTTTATSTDAQGMFILQSPGNFDSIVVTSIGYADKRMAAGDKSQSLVITLIATSNSLNAVKVLGIKQAQSITTLTTEDLNRSSGLSLQNALNLVPGVDMQNREPWGGDRIIIRGYMPNLGNTVNTSNGYGYQAFIDNIPITDATGNTILDDIDNSELGKVEIIKGPASPLYGSYIGGSVNLFTPIVAPGTTSIQEQVVGGSYGLARTNTTIETATDKSSIWINYGDQVYNGFRTEDNSRKEFASFAGKFQTSDKNTVSSYFSYNSSYEGLSGELDSDQVYGRKAVPDTDYLNNSSHVKIESMRGGLTDMYKFSNHISNQTTIFVTTHSIDQVIAHGYTDYQEADFGGRTAFNFHYGNVDGIVGGSFQKLTEMVNGIFILPFHVAPFYPSTPVASYTDQQNYALNYNTFTQWSFKLPSSITLTVGGSLNFSEFGIRNMLLPTHLLYNNPPTYIDAINPAFTPSASLIKVFNENVSAYASYGMGYTPPGLSYILTTTGQVVSGLKPETANQYEIGTKGNLANGKFSYQLALYDLDITNRLVEEYVNSVGSYTNAGEQRDMGAELYLAYNAVNNKDGAVNLLRPWVSYTYDDATYVTFNTYTTSKVTHNDSVSASYSGKKVAAVAPNMINAGIDLGTKAGIYFHLTYQYMDKVPVTFDNEHYMNSYSLLNARLGYKHQFGHLTMDAYVGVDNMLGETYYTSIFIGPNINGLAQSNDYNYVNAKGVPVGSGDGYILPAPYTATFYGGLSLKYTF